MNSDFYWGGWIDGVCGYPPDPHRNNIVFRKDDIVDYYDGFDAGRSVKRLAYVNRITDEGKKEA